MTQGATLLEMAGGEAGVLRLAEAWHARAVADEVVGHAFSHGFHPRHTERLAAYWAEVLGGPARFSASYGGHASVLAMHAGTGAEPDLGERLPTLVERIGGVRIRAVGNTYEAGLGEDLQQAYDDVLAACTST